MNIKEKLDLAIKLSKKGSTDGAYSITHNGKTLQKQTYMTNEEWDAFALAMKSNELQPNAYLEYSEGGGDELSEKNGRPPKMASYGSSSRMIYKLSAGKEGFHYEKSCPPPSAAKQTSTAFMRTRSAVYLSKQSATSPIQRKQIR